MSCYSTPTQIIVMVFVVK